MAASWLLGGALASVCGGTFVVLLRVCSAGLVTEAVISYILGWLAGGLAYVQGMVEQVTIQRERVSASVSLLPADARIACTSTDLQVSVTCGRALFLGFESFSESRAIVDILGVVSAFRAVLGRTGLTKRTYTLCKLVFFFADNCDRQRREMHRKKTYDTLASAQALVKAL